MQTSNPLFAKKNIDVVFCIDGTGSMGPCIDAVKANIRKFPAEYTEILENMGCDAFSLRAKVIVFRDYASEGEQAMLESPFFALPEESGDFEKYVADIVEYGGGDSPENGLEALYYAMKSDLIAGARDRQVIVLLTDAEALPLKERADAFGYPADMVDEEGLIDMWYGKEQGPDFKLRQRCKRLVMFAPSGTRYRDLCSKLDRSYFEPVNRQEGLSDIDWPRMVAIVAEGSY